MRGQQFNPAAGFRRIGARKAARQLDHQVEATARVMAADRLLVDLIGIVRDVHEHLKGAEVELVSANRIACSSEYEPPAQIGPAAVAS